MSAYLEKQKLLDWLGNVYIPYIEENADDGWRIAPFLEGVLEKINDGCFDWQPND
jgi:hypothetical protein